MLFIFAPQLGTGAEKTYFSEEHQPLMTVKTALTILSALCFAVVSFGCGGGANTGNTNAKPANTASTTTTTTTNTSSTTKAESSSPDTGVPECDEYITKYEACLTTIAAKAPQAAPGLKAGFEAQRNGFKAAASTPQGKAILAGQCKTYTDQAKAATSQWCTNW